ncbi:histidine kinase, partial [Salmonella enterica subsp. enterica serovar Istanbul]|nr:histidine kinase [Salmonella enterica subsp. enterica serovar Istanbul]
PMIEADDARFAQVMINLLVNAAQALPEGDSASHEIRLVTSTDAAGRAVIEVRDTGAGIPAANLDRIFDPFFTTKAVGTGTGLGLSICHTLVSGMGGTITVESEEGRGTSFRVAIP